MIRVGVGIAIGLLIGMAVPAIGQQMFAGSKCSEFSGWDEHTRSWYILGAADAVLVLHDGGRLTAPELQQRFVGLPMAAFVGAVYGTCLSQPWERVGRVVLRLIGYDL
jgi:hypothetical protein